MSFESEVSYLLDYTDWDRAQWEAWFRGQDAGVYALGLGANLDSRVTTIGELVRHIFSAEQRYVDRITGDPLTDTAVVPSNDADALFDFGRRSRKNMRALLRDFPEKRWIETREMQLGPNNTRRFTAKTMVVQAITHEIRHWAQIATFLRIEGRKTGAHDFLVSGIYERDLKS